MVPPVTNRHNILPDSPSGWPEELRKINWGRKNVAAVMSATAKFMRRKLIEVLGKISEINAISRRKIKTLFVKDICRLGHKSSFFLSPCGTRWSADMCRWNSFKQGTTLGTRLNRVYTFTIDRMSLRLKAFEQCRVNVGRLCSRHIPYQLYQRFLKI